jgi:DNA polymerase III psi subunit
MNIRETILANAKEEENTDGVELECIHCGVTLSTEIDAEKVKAIAVEQVSHMPECPMTRERILSSDEPIAMLLEELMKVHKRMDTIEQSLDDAAYGDNY